MRELNIVEASWSMDASGSWLKLRPELPGQAQMVAGEMDPQKKYTVTIKEFRKKRSLDANAYIVCDCYNSSFAPFRAKRAEIRVKLSDEMEVEITDNGQVTDATVFL